MKKLISTFIITVLLSSLFSSCGTQECVNNNPILQNNNPESAEYTQELATILKNADQSKLNYFLMSYNQQANSRSMIVNVQGPDVCAKMKVEFEDLQKGAEAIIQKKGISFAGAQLQGLKYEIKEDSLDTKFVFISLTSIND